MGETATCPKCGNQGWNIDAGRVICVQCRYFFLLHPNIPSTEVMQLINDPKYGVLKVDSGEEM